MTRLCSDNAGKVKTFGLGPPPGGEAQQCPNGASGKDNASALLERWWCGSAHKFSKGCTYTNCLFPRRSLSPCLWCWDAAFWQTRGHLVVQEETMHSHCRPVLHAIYSVVMLVWLPRCRWTDWHALGTRAQRGEENVSKFVQLELLGLAMQTSLLLVSYVINIYIYMLYIYIICHGSGGPRLLSTGVGSTATTPRFHWSMRS